MAAHSQAPTDVTEQTDPTAEPAPTLTIRAAEASDVRALAALAAETFPLACPSHSTPESIIAFIALHFTEARFEEYLGDPERALLVASDHEGALVGYAMLIAGEPSDADAAAAVGSRPVLELSKFYTRAAHHGRGVAAPLMTAVLDVARAAGAQGVWLGVNEENARARRFYEKHGFTVVGTKRFVVGDRVEDDFVLEHRLVAASA